MLLTTPGGKTSAPHLRNHIRVDAVLLTDSLRQNREWIESPSRNSPLKLNRRRGMDDT